MERQQPLSPKLERTSSFEIVEPLTLTKKQYEAALAAVIQAYGSGNTSEQLAGGSIEQPKKMEGVIPAAKGCNKP